MNSKKEIIKDLLKELMGKMDESEGGRISMMIAKKKNPELEMGKEEEKEHGETLMEIIDKAKKGGDGELVEEGEEEIAEDHLDEDDKYYSKLKGKMGGGGLMKRLMMLKGK